MKKRTLFRDGIEESIIGKITVRETSEGHIVECYRLADGRKRFFATIAGTHYCAHGNTLANAISDALWKDPLQRPSMESLRDSIKKKGINHMFTLSEFRLLTGACLEGCRSALSKAGKDESPMTVKDICKYVSGDWGKKLISIMGWKEEANAC